MLLMMKASNQDKAITWRRSPLKLPVPEVEDQNRACERQESPPHTTIVEMLEVLLAHSHDKTCAALNIV